MLCMHAISIVLDLYSILLCLLLVLGLYYGAPGPKKLKRVFMWMCLMNMGTLLGDIPNWLCEGLDYGWYSLALKGGCFLLYLCAILLLLAYTKYIICYLESRTLGPQQEESKQPHSCSLVHRGYSLAVDAIGAVYLFCFALSQFNGMFYWIDRGNVYHRGSFYMLSQALALLILLIDLIIIVSYRSYLHRKERIAFYGYIIFTIFAAAVQLLFYGLSLTYTANTIALLVIFIDIQSRQGFVPV